MWRLLCDYRLYLKMRQQILEKNNRKTKVYDNTVLQRRIARFC